MSLIQLIYASAATKPFNQDDLRELLLKARTTIAAWISVDFCFITGFRSFRFSKAKSKSWTNCMGASATTRAIRVWCCFQRQLSRSEHSAHGAWGLLMWIERQPRLLDS